LSGDELSEHETLAGVERKFWSQFQIFPENHRGLYEQGGGKEPLSERRTALFLRARFLFINASVSVRIFIKKV